MALGPPRHGVRRFARPLALALGAFLVFGVAPGITSVRHAMSAPLIVHDPDARGDAAYVMAGGLASEERLRAAADLFHMGRVPRVYLLRDDGRSYYSFTERRSLSHTEWMVGYLGWLGVPRDRITLVADQGGSRLGSLHEADLMRQALPPEVRRLVVVTSPAHTRRSGLAFRRRLGPDVAVTTHAAIDVALSAEAFAPLWLEYLKLAVYTVVA
jgi:DUF218 domain